MYWLHLTKKNGLKSSDFFREFSEYVDSLAISKGHLLIVGDFNIHWDSPSDANTKHLSSILKSASLTQHVQERTHRHGHMLDLVIYHEDDTFVNKVSLTSMLSDHVLDNIELSLKKPSIQPKLCHIIRINQLIKMDLLEIYAPLKSKQMSQRALLPWYNKDIQAAKRH